MTSRELTEWQIYFRVESEEHELLKDNPGITPEDLADAIEAGSDTDTGDIDFTKLDELTIARVLEVEAFEGDE